MQFLRLILQSLVPRFSASPHRVSVRALNFPSTPPSPLFSFSHFLGRAPPPWSPASARSHCRWVGSFIRSLVCSPVPPSRGGGDGAIIATVGHSAAARKQNEKENAKERERRKKTGMCWIESGTPVAVVLKGTRAARFDGASAHAITN